MGNEVHVLALERVSALRKWAGRVAALFCLLFFLSLLDASVSRFREPSTYLACIPGQLLTVTGPLGAADNLQKLTYVSDSDKIRLMFESVHTGFWLGGLQWRGRIVVDSDTPPGGYQLAVPIHKQGGSRSIYRFSINVFRDRITLRKASFSYIERHAGVSPWVSALFFLALTVPTGVGVFFLSQRVEYLLAHEGRAEVYRVVEGKEGYQIFFGLGAKHGIRPGDSLTVVRPKNVPIGTATVEEVFEYHSSARTAFLQPAVSPGFIVSVVRLGMSDGRNRL